MPLMFLSLYHHERILNTKEKIVFILFHLSFISDVTDQMQHPSPEVVNVNQDMTLSLNNSQSNGIDRYLYILFVIT